MAAVEEIRPSAVETATDPTPKDQSAMELKDVKSVGATANTHDVEDGEILPSEEKTYYSKVSVWLMVLFSGLAIGSDG